MNEENIKPLDEKKKLSLLRYLAVLFAVAFLFVLISLLTQMRNSNQTISQLTQSSTSALQKAEQLQETNRRLETDLAQTKQAYELLLTAMEADEDSLAEALEPLADQIHYLDQAGLDVYESLLEKVEKNND